MGESVDWAEGVGLLPNGLSANAGPMLPVLDVERWKKAEERTAELIACIQPNSPSEERRTAVADYVQRLIAKCFACQVFTFGSVPLKTYLPDGDIDLTAFSNNPSLKDSWATQVRDLLEKEEKDDNAEFCVQEVQYIQAEVKIIKCLVDNIVVDISFNQLGGLCTLCFLEEVDNLISQDHLFKRSIILIKAWCYYESRILGAHHGLISTYALETLVLYIFNVFDNSFSGPLEVLYRFLEFFSNFDWDNFCVSLWGPVPISSLPDVTAEPPRKDSGTLLLNKLFLDACSSVYAVFPAGQENYGQPFVSKHFNVIDPLRVNNNLGRSVSKGNFFRIRSAFAFGAKRLAKLLDCPKESLLSEVNQFFTNTWGRHGSGNRPDAPGTNLWQLKLSSSHHENRLHFDSSYGNGRFLLARTNSSPELTDSYGKPGKASENSKEEQDLVNIMASNNLNGFSGHVPVPFNLASPHHHIPFSPSDNPAERSNDNFENGDGSSKPAVTYGKGKIISGTMPDNSGVVAFYPTGPPVPFITMLPMYNMPQETGNSDASTKESKSDILNSDFASHWQNLQFGRFCQHPRIENGPPIYPSPVMVPPVYLQGGFPMEGSGIPHSSNMNIVSQLIGYGPRLSPPNVYQYYVDEIPRQRSGTGTYLPNLKISPQERPSSGNRRGGYNWNGKAKPRGHRVEKVKSRLHDSRGMHSFPRGPDDRSVVMMYPFQHGEQLEPPEQSQLSEGSQPRGSFNDPKFHRRY